MRNNENNATLLGKQPKQKFLKIATSWELKSSLAAHQHSSIQSIFCKKNLFSNSNLIYMLKRLSRRPNTLRLHFTNEQQYVAEWVGRSTVILRGLPTHPHPHCGVVDAAAFVTARTRK